MTTSLRRRVLRGLLGTDRSHLAEPPARAGYSIARRVLAGLLGVRLVTPEIRLPGHKAIRLVQVWDDSTGVQNDDLDVASQEAVHVPLVGRIAAGTPILAVEDLQEVMHLPRELVGWGDLIMLTVVGDSMINAAIVDGDMVVVRKEADVFDGDIVAALISDDISANGEVEATVKTFRNADGRIWLLPQNPDYAPIAADTATIIGKVVAVLRRM